jgi:hypothetical protein
LGEERSCQDEDVSEKKRRRAVGPAGAKPAVEEPLAERQEPSEAEEQRDLERYLSDRPPHHEPR